MSMNSYHDLVDAILHSGEVREDRTGTGTLPLFGEQVRADRYEITDNNASIRCQKPGKGPLILYACDHDSSTQKIIAVIRQLRADLAAVSAERDRLRDAASG